MEQRAALQDDLGRPVATELMRQPLAPAAKNARIPALQKKITRARAAAAAATTARKPIPAKLPASAIDPDARVALLRAGRRGLQMVLRLLARNAEHWLSGHLNAYLCDDDEYRAITRETIIRGLAGTITWTPAAITVQLERPRAPRIARALSLLIEEINATPPAMPGDSRPITYHLAPPARHLTPNAQPSPEIWGRPHQGIAQRVPDGERDGGRFAVADLDRELIHRKPVLGGLINEYSHAA